MPGTLMSSRQAEFDLTNTRIALSKTAICSRTCRQATSIGPDNQHDVGTVKYQSFNLPIEGQSPHPAGQKAERLEYAPDVIGQSRRHADESCAGQRWLHRGKPQALRMMSPEQRR